MVIIDTPHTFPRHSLPVRYGAYFIRLIIAGLALALCLVCAGIVLPFHIADVILRKKKKNKLKHNYENHETIK